MEEYKVGETFQFGLKTLECVEQEWGNCDNCFLQPFAEYGCELLTDCAVGYCDKLRRSDNKAVAFIEVEETNKQEGDKMKQTVGEAAHSFAESRSSGSMFPAYYDGFIAGAEWELNKHE